MPDGTFVAYYRVSTAKQGKSGLGLEAQRKSVSGYLNGGTWQLIDEYIEVETGTRNDRPQLQEALSLCKATGAKLVVAKIDRLSRNAEFLLSLKNSGVDFVAADMPDANRLTVGIMAVIAEQERELISKRTKDALAAAKARGVKLGAYRGDVFVGRVGTAEDARRASEARTALFQQRYHQKAHLLKRFDPDGSASLRQIANSMNEAGVPTISGTGRWSANSVKRLRDFVQTRFVG